MGVCATTRSSTSSARDATSARAATRAPGPDDRLDGFRVALAVEGGSRATYSSGMVLALEELGLTRCFDAVYGSSAGALAGSWLVAGSAAHCCAGWWKPGLMERVTNPRRGLRGRPVVDVEYLIHTVGESIVPLDWQAVVDARSVCTRWPAVSPSRAGTRTEIGRVQRISRKRPVPVGLVDLDDRVASVTFLVELPVVGLLNWWAWERVSGHAVRADLGQRQRPPSLSLLTASLPAAPQPFPPAQRRSTIGRSPSSPRRRARSTASRRSGAPTSAKTSRSRRSGASRTRSKSSDGSPPPPEVLDTSGAPPVAHPLR